MSLINITNNLLTNIEWLDAKTSGFSIDGGVDIWRINIIAHLPLLRDLYPILHPSEIEKSLRYFQEKDKNRYLISRAALRLILGKYLNIPPKSIEFGIGTNKKPHVLNASLQYNISHSGDWIVIAVSGSAVGVDVEMINPGFDYTEIIKEFFSDGEISYINEEQSADRFFMLWTRKEALTKATAKGLDDDLKLIPGLAGEHAADGKILCSDKNWLVNTIYFAENYITSVATDVIVTEKHFMHVNLNELLPRF